MGRITTRTLAFSYRNGEDNEEFVASVILLGTVLIKDVVLKIKM